MGSKVLGGSSDVISRPQLSCPVTGLGLPCPPQSSPTPRPAALLLLGVFAQPLGQPRGAAVQGHDPGTQRGSLAAPPPAVTSPRLCKRPAVPALFSTRLPLSPRGRRLARGLERDHSPLRVWGSTVGATHAPAAPCNPRVAAPAPTCHAASYAPAGFSHTPHTTCTRLEPRCQLVGV